jgi:hypothetical protein
MIDVPAGWSAVLFRAVTTAVVAFVVLQLKEWHDAGVFDTLGTAADGLLIGGGVFVVNAVLKWAKP